MFQSLIENIYIAHIEATLAVVFLCLSYLNKNYIYPAWVLGMPIIFDYLTEIYISDYSFALYYFGIFFTHAVVAYKLIAVGLKTYGIIIFLSASISLCGAIVATTVQEYKGIDASSLGLIILLIYTAIYLAVIYLSTQNAFEGKP